MEKAIQCTDCGVLTKEKHDVCECCGNPFMIEVTLPQEDDYVYYDEDVEDIIHSME